jgi:hypothetical protein
MRTSVLSAGQYLLMLVDGATVSAATGTNLRAAADARAAADTLLAAAARPGR